MIFYYKVRFNSFTTFYQCFLLGTKSLVLTTTDLALGVVRDKEEEGLYHSISGPCQSYDDDLQNSKTAGMYSSIRDGGTSKTVGMYQSINGQSFDDDLQNSKSFDDDENLKNGGAPIYESIDHQSQLQNGQL